MKANFAKLILALALASMVLPARGNEEQDLIAVLKSNGGAAEKSAACVRLRIVGSAAAVPALADLLPDERTAHAARHALEAIPGPDAAAALAGGLKQANGDLKAGLIDSLGVRPEIPVGLIAPLLADGHPSVAAAAARALGRDGGTEAIEALLAQSAKGSVPAQEALLACADRRQGEEIARRICEELLQAEAPESIRAAAWRGMVLNDPAKQADRISAALSGGGWEHQVALKMVYETKDAALLEECAKNWDRLPAQGQLALLHARLKLGGEVLRLALKASSSPRPAVRTAAWQALGDLNANAAVPELARAAARGEGAEKAAAHDALCRINGAQEPILKAIATAGPEEKTELLQVLGERAEPGSGGVLLRHAADSNEEARLAALDSLRRIGEPETLEPLIGIAAHCRSETECEPVMKALEGICRAAPDKEKAAAIVLKAMSGAESDARRRFMSLLPELGTAAALEALKRATAGTTAEESREAVRAMARWPNAGPAPQLLALARTHSNLSLQVLAVRGAVELAGHEPDPGRRVALLTEALAAAKRPAEKKQALAALGAIATAESLELVQSALDDPDVGDEAALAAIGIVEKLANPDLARKTAERVLESEAQPEVLARAWKLRGKPAAGPFIRNWSVAGPFAKSGAAGAPALFEAVFAPENGGTSVEWKPIPEANQANLAAIFPGRDNCAAYLKTRVVAPERCSAVLLLGSDDGVKAWFNGTVVHSNNVDRGDVPDQDAALIELKQGANELMLKISQGGGGWSAHARIVGLDGRPIAGLRDER